MSGVFTGFRVKSCFFGFLEIGVVKGEQWIESVGSQLYHTEDNSGPWVAELRRGFLLVQVPSSLSLSL